MLLAFKVCMNVLVLVTGLSRYWQLLTHLPTRLKIANKKFWPVLVFEQYWMSGFFLAVKWRKMSLVSCSDRTPEIRRKQLWWKGQQGLYWHECFWSAWQVTKTVALVTAKRSPGGQWQTTTRGEIQIPVRKVMPWQKMQVRWLLDQILVPARFLASRMLARNFEHQWTTWMKL